MAVTTAILATVGALISYQGSATQNDALLFKNEAAIKKTASDQWNYYQAKSSKQNLAELGSTLTTGEVAERYRVEAKRYGDEKKEVQVKAEAFERPPRKPTSTARRRCTTTTAGRSR